MENLGSDFDLESYIDLSQSGTSMWLGTKDQELTKILDDLDTLPRVPMTNLQNTEVSQKACTKQYVSARGKKSRFGNPVSDTEQSSFTKLFIPVSTQKNTR